MPLRVPRTGLGIALLLAGFAALRVWSFGFAFPFFTNVDEVRHVDAVLKYARGAGPAAGLVPYEPETARLLGLLGSPEYHRHPSAPVRADVPPPGWALPGDAREARIAEMEAYLRPLHSLEAGQPPVYYATAGAWLAAARGLGLRDGALLYAVRALGGLAAAVLVFASFVLLRQVYGDRPTLVFGVPLLLAVMPQDALYYVTGDAASPLLGGLAFLGVSALVARPAAGPWRQLAVGLALSAALLAKYPNAALYVAALGAAFAVWRRDGGARPLWPVLWGAAALPPLAWFARNAALGLGVTGTSAKSAKLGWAPKPLDEWFDHPLWSVSGIAEFLHDLAASFWRGELVWHQEFLAVPAVDAVYVAASALALCFALAALLRRRADAVERSVERMAAASLCAAIGLLMLLSLAFVFSGTVHPSPAYPFFSNGRLIGGVTLCFALLFVRGLEEGASHLPAKWRTHAFWGVLGGIALLSLASEIALTLPVFGSAYNAYHLP